MRIQEAFARSCRGGSDSPFSFQLWQIQQPSVCRPYQQDVRRFSQCTVKASAMFHKLCDDLTRQDDSSWQQSKFRTMYCSAAISYRPLIAEIRSTEIGDAKQSPAKLAERASNQAILAAMDSDDEALLAQRDKACAAVQ